MALKNKIKPEKTSYGTYRVRFVDGRNRRHCKTFKTKILALNFCKKLNKGELPQENSFQDLQRRPVKTFGDLARKYMSNHVKINCSHSTNRNYEMYLRIHILPFFENICLTELHLTDLDDFAASLNNKKRQRGERDRNSLFISRKTVSKKKSLSEKMRRELISLVLSITSYGCVRDYLERDPFKTYRLKKVSQKKIGYFNGKEVEKFLLWCEQGGPYTVPGRLDKSGQPLTFFTSNIERDTEIFKFALNTGAREGEILGLKRKAIDFSNRLVWFSEIYDLSAKEMAERTKGKNVRCIEFNEVVEEILRKYEGLAPNELIFKISTRPLWMDAFYIYCNRAGVKPVSFHALRHTFASAMALYTPPPVLQQMLGHESLTTTMKYVHIAQSDSIGFTKRLKSIYREHRNLKELAKLTLHKVS